MTYNVSSGTLNSTILYYTPVHVYLHFYLTCSRVPVLLPHLLTNVLLPYLFTCSPVLLPHLFTCTCTFTSPVQCTSSSPVHLYLYFFLTCTCTFTSPVPVLIPHLFTCTCTFTSPVHLYLYLTCSQMYFYLTCSPVPVLLPHLYSVLLPNLFTCTCTFTSPVHLNLTSFIHLFISTWRYMSLSLRGNSCSCLWNVSCCCMHDSHIKHSVYTTEL